MPSLTPATASTGTLTAATAATAAEAAAAVGSGTFSAAAVLNGDGLYCSETLACSDTAVTCTDADGINASSVSTGSLTPA